MVRENPKQLTKVSAVPLYSEGVAWATNVENWGESAVTNIPQISRKPIQRKTGESGSIQSRRQQIPDPTNENKATVLDPFLTEINPPIPQEIAPTPMMANERYALKAVWEGFELK